MRGETWKDQWQPPCRARGKLKLAPRRWLQSRRLHPKRFSKRCMVVKWNLMNPHGNAWKLLHLRNMKIALQAKGLLRCLSTIWHTSSSHCHKQWRFRMQRLQWTRNGKSSRQFHHGNWKSQKEVILEAQGDKKESPLCCTDGHVSPQERGVRTKITKKNTEAESCSVVTL